MLEWNIALRRAAEVLDRDIGVRRMEETAQHLWRTCQECGNVQEDTLKLPMTIAYENRKCKKCKSEALDYGSPSDPRIPAPEEKED